MDPIPSSWSVLDPTAADRADQTPAVGASAGSRAHVVVAVGIALVVAAALGVALVARSSGVDERSVVLPSAAASAGASADADTIVVEVVGAVRHPGLVRLAPNSRVADAIAAAGGYSPAVDTAAVAAGLRLAKGLADGDQVRVPTRGEESSVASSGQSGGAVAGGAGSAGGTHAPVDLNSASEAELDALPGIGPATVAKIVAARAEHPFASVDELRERKVVGEATLAKIRDLVVVR